MEHNALVYRKAHKFREVFAKFTYGQFPGKLLVNKNAQKFNVLNPFNNIFAKSMIY